MSDYRGLAAGACAARAEQYIVCSTMRGVLAARVSDAAQTYIS